VPNLRTMVTELGTGLGMLGNDDLDEVLATRSAVMRSLSPDDWDLLSSVRAGGAYDTEFHSAWLNGRTFLTARDGLRGRRPEIVEWKGAVRGSGDEVAPVDLRIDHVYLVSCKYMSDILFNASPAHIFDSLLVGGLAGRRRGAGADWFAEVAPTQYQQLFDVVRLALEGEEAGSAFAPGGRTGDAGTQPLALPGLGVSAGTGSSPQGAVARHSSATLGDLPHRATDLTSAHRIALGERLKAGWPGDAKAAYRELSDEVARLSVSRWHAALSVGAHAGEAMLWRLLRMGSAPYFVLGSSAARSLRLRIATPWDWKQLFRLVKLEIFPQPGGQPRVGWNATVRERASGQTREVSGHVEVRWSHGRFGGPPEAKGYLDTSHHLVPGYFPLQ
jgi:hypothetical protein